jgi:hypothetical protein
MSAVVSAPVDWIENIGHLKLPKTTDRRLQYLMDKNTEGALSDMEREELVSLVDLSEQLSLLRAGALRLLGKRPE